MTVWTFIRCRCGANNLIAGRPCYRCGATLTKTDDASRERAS